VKIELDIRDSDEARRDGVLEKVRDAIATISTRRSVVARTELLNADPPAICDGKIVTALARAAETHQMKFERLVSRAYHDALFMARIAPSAMLFIPCRGGVSHRPDEYSSPEAIADGVLVLAETLADLAR
jgi:N-carbamoyl-L-amino-acid hydrolase